ncbi:MAG: 50S ribosomal protein L23 [Candidatus Shapirobacteria bacterium]
MNLSQVVQKPVLTEKAMGLRDQGIWSFYVHPQATKGMVEKAVGEYLGVEAQKVRIINLAPKTKNLWRQKRKVVLKRSKKAMIWLKKGEKIKNV